MDLQDHTIPPPGHESHQGVHLCHRCGWPFPNPHPSAKHRRNHKKHCGTIEGYTKLSQVVSDDEEKTPSPKIEKKMSMSGDGIIGSVSRTEEDLFSDAVTEFSDSGKSAGSANKTLDKDLFFSFNDNAENGGTNDVVNTPLEKSGPAEVIVSDSSELLDKDTHDVVNTPIEISNVDFNPEVSEKQDFCVEESGPTEVTVTDSSELIDKDAQCLDGLVKDRVVEPTPGSSYAKSIEVVEAGEGKSQESQTLETTAEESQTLETTAEEIHNLETTVEEAKDSDISQTTPEVVEIVGGYNDIIKQQNFEKLEPATADGVSEEMKQEMESACEHVSEVANESETVESTEGIKHEMSELEDVVVTPEVVKQSETVDEIKHQKSEPSEIAQAVSVLTEKDVDLTEKQDIGAPESDTVLTAKEDLGEPVLEEGSNEHTHEDVEVPGSVLIVKENLGEPELEKCSKERIQEVMKEPDTVLTEKEDLEEPKLEKHPDEPIQEAVEKPNLIVTQKEDLGAPILEKGLNENTLEVTERKADDVSNDVCIETITSKDSSDNSIDCVKTASDVVPKPLVEEGNDDKLINDQEGEQKADHVSNDVADVCVTPKDSSDNIIDVVKDASGLVSKPLVEEGNDKLTNNQESGAALSVEDSSSRNSLEGNWGSVSVLSTASIDGGDKSKVNIEKSTTAATSDVYEPPSFMTLVQHEGKDLKSDVQDSEQQKPNSEAVSREGWFPTLPKVNNESEGRKRNEEAIAKVTNWSSSSGKQSTPLKNLLGEAKSPNATKQPEPLVQKDEAKAAGETQDVASPPKLIEDGKKGGKKVKGRSSWIPFVCCSSVNVVK